MEPVESLNHQKAKKSTVKVREMTIDDLADVFHMGEKLFLAEKAPNTYRAWDEYEVADLFYSDTEFCLVAEYEDQVVGFALGTIISKSRSAWKYGYLLWLGVIPEFQKKGKWSKASKRPMKIYLSTGKPGISRVIPTPTSCGGRASSPSCWGREA